MNEDLHGRAERLIIATRVEGITAADREWLDSHLETCARCAGRAAALERALAALRSVSISLDPALVEAARRRVRLRARELREHEARMHALWMACALSWVLGVVSAPLLWWALEWIGERIAVPKPIWFVGFLFWWIVPAVVVAGFLTWRKARTAGENSYATIEPR